MNKNLYDKTWKRMRHQAKKAQFLIDQGYKVFSHYGDEITKIEMFKGMIHTHHRSSILGYFYHKTDLLEDNTNLFDQWKIVDFRNPIEGKNL